MSAGAVRQGRVFVEIGADPKEFLSAVGQVNRQIANLGSSMSEVGIKLGAIGAAITAPIAAAAAQFGNLSDVVKGIQSYAGLGARDITGLVKAAADLGIVLDRQTATAALQLAASTTKMRLSLVGVAVTVGSIVAPEFTGFAERMATVAKGVSTFLRENRKIVTVSLAAGGALTAAGMALTTVGGALKAFGSNTSFLIGPMFRMVKLAGLVAVNMARLAVTMAITGAAGAAMSLRGAIAGLLGTMASLGKSLAILTVRFGSFVAIAGISGAAAAIAVFAGIVSSTLGVIGGLVLAIGLVTQRMIAIRAASLAAGAGMVALGTAKGAVSVLSFFTGLPKTIASGIGALVRFGIVIASVGASAAAVAAGFAAVSAAVYVVGGSLLKAVGGFDGIKKAALGAANDGIGAFKRAMPDMLEVTNLTVTAAYDRIAAGDFAGAVGVLWDGAKAAWTVGSSAIMGVLDPWIESVQNAWGNMVTYLVNAWDRGFAALATSEWGGYLVGAFDNIINGLMASWDWMVGSLQKGWAWIQSKFKAGFDIEAEFRRIDKENTDRAKQRGIDRPGMEGRTNLTDAEKARIRADAEARIAERIAGNEQAQRDRRTRTEQRAADRPGAVRDAIADLRGRIKDVAANVPDKAPIVPQQIAGPAQVAGTFSAFAAGGMGMATKGIAEQQLDILKQIAFNTKEQAKVGP